MMLSHQRAFPKVDDLSSVKSLNVDDPSSVGSI